MRVSSPPLQISSPGGEVNITNDGATILKMMEVAHPTAKMLVDLSKSQDVEAGDGTTSVTVIAGSLLNQAEMLLQKGIHPTVISESFLLAAKKSTEILKAMSVPVDLNDRELLVKAASEAAVESYGRAPQHLAAACARSELLQPMLDVNREWAMGRDIAGFLPLHLAADTCVESKSARGRARSTSRCGSDA